jgi:HK97 family phage major capsid protein
VEPETKALLTTIDDAVKAIATQQATQQRQIDAVDLKIAERAIGGVANENFVEKQLKECESVSRLLRDRKGSAVIRFEGQAVSQLMERKTTMLASSLGFMTTGVMPIDRIPGITPEARQELTIRDALFARSTNMALVDYVKVTTPLTIASPVPEGSTKPENQLVFTSFSEKVRTLATFIPASRQLLDDMQELMGFIETSLPYYVNLAEEIQLLSGDATGENLHGLIPQATAFNNALLPATTPTRIDAIGAAIAQITIAKELQPTFAVMHPADWWGMRLLKDTYGRYILGDPQQVVTPSLFGLRVIPTVNIAQHSFLVGSGSPTASEIRDRMEMVVEISTEHANFFIQNLIAIRAEKRLALITKRAASYVYGSFAALP